jgi:predicted nucleic acid-binding protein
MQMLVDTNALIYLLDRRPKDDLRVRIEGLVKDIEDSKGQLIVPTLVIAEYLVNADSAREAILDKFIKSKFIRIAPFDMKAAVECADMDSLAKNSGNKRSPFSRTERGPDWQKIKVDRQVVAIAKTYKATIVGGDTDVASICTWAGVKHLPVLTLPIPEYAKQRHIELVGGHSISPS